MRQEFSPKIKVAAFKRAWGRCEGCSGQLYTGKFHYDHVNPDGLTGEPTLENCAVLCVACHSTKTKDDVSNIAKAKRRERRHLGADKPATMPGSRNSQWKKRMDGIVERRTP